MNVEITVPDDYAGAVIGDLTAAAGAPWAWSPRARSGHQGRGADGGDAHLRAELSSMTGAAAGTPWRFYHYDEVPAHLQEKIVAAAKAERGDVKEEE